MGRYEGVLLMSDFDGTLGDCTTGVSAENCEAIRKFQAQGGLFSLASGRFPSYLSEMSRFFVPNTYSVLLNGSVICSAPPVEPVFGFPLGDEIVDFTETVREACPRLDFIRYHSYDGFYDINAGERDFAALRAGIPPVIYKLIFHTPAEKSDEYKSVISELAAGRYHVSRSWVNGIELQRADASKGDAVLRMKDLLGDRAAVVVAAGDYENDIDMLRQADIGYAVGNASDAVKAAADRIAPDYRRHAIAQIIEEI